MCYLSPAVQSGCTTVVTEQIAHARFYLSGRLGKANFLSGNSAGKVKHKFERDFFFFFFHLRFGTEITNLLYHVAYKPKQHFQFGKKKKKTPHKSQ